MLCGINLFLFEASVNLLSPFFTHLLAHDFAGFGQKVVLIHCSTKICHHGLTAAAHT